jgi:predicted transcriptional regulator
MNESLIEQLENDKQCEHMLGCLYGLNEADIECYKYVVEQGQIENDILSDILDKDESTTNRSLSRLVDAGLVKKETESYEQGGYKYIYSATNPSKVAQRMKVLMTEWVSNSYRLVEQYEEKYDDFSR